MPSSETLKNIFQRHRGVIYFLSILTFLRLLYIYFIPITPQEAYYWCYSLRPDWSYFDHPAMVAYSIWLGTHIFGQTIFGIKFMAVIWSLLTNIVLYLTILEATYQTESERRKQLALLAVGLYNLTIFAHLYAVVIVPDTPLLFFWMLIIFLLVRFLKTGQKKNLYFAGLALGFGLISKYTAIAILPAVLIIILMSPEYRRVLLTPHPYLALMLTMIVFSVVIIWNMQQDWVSLKFQFADRSAEMKPLQTKYFFQLVASQLFMLTPMPLIYFFTSTRRVISGWRDLKIARNIMLTGIFIIGGFILISFRSLVKMNWLLPGYMGLIVTTILVYPKLSFSHSGWVKTGVGISIFLIITAHLLLIIPNVPLGEGNTWSGWQDAAEKINELEQQYGGSDKNFIFANSYKTASLLKFYLPGHGDVYAQNIYDEPALQYDIWGIPDSLTGKNAFFIFTDRYEYQANLANLELYFGEIMFIDQFETYFLDKYKTRTIICYYAKNYKGRGGKENL